MRAGSARLYRRGRVWWCWGYTASGKRWCASTKCRDRLAAEHKARELERRFAAASRAPTLTLERALEALIDSARANERSAATIEIREAKAGHLLRVFGRTRNVHELTLADCEAYMQQRRTTGEDGEHASLHTVAKELWTLRAALRQLARAGRYGGDPSRLMPAALEGAYVPRDRWLTLAEFDRLLLAMPLRRDWLVAYVYTGVRYSELHALTAADLDTDAAALSVRGTKTRASHRTIPLHPRALEVLSRRADGADVGAPLFPRWHRGSAIRDLRAACERAEIPPVSHNDLRRTCASWLAQAGVPALTTARILGHASTRMVELVYSRLDLGTLRSAVERLPAAPATCSRDVANSAYTTALHGLHGRRARPKSSKILVKGG